MENIKEVVNNLHQEFIDAMNDKYSSQYTEDDIKDIFDTPMTFMGWCIRENKIDVKPIQSN